MKPEIHEVFMKRALVLAREACASGEIPVGAVIVMGEEIIAEGKNSGRCSANPVRHAEINAVENACAAIKNERLTGASLYVTKEPCVMCAGALIHSRILKVFIGTRDSKYGACGTVFDILGNKRFNHVPEIIFGVLEDECGSVLREFFRNIRENRKERC